jgi:hypothetical protein
MSTGHKVPRYVVFSTPCRPHKATGTMQLHVPQSLGLWIAAWKTKDTFNAVATSDSVFIPGAAQIVEKSVNWER